jgi:hypothetical protein
MSDLLETYAEILAEEIQREIDAEIVDNLMCIILKEKGWTSCPIKNPYIAEVSEWIHKNSKGDYKNIQGNWWFEDGSDAMMFLLRWS